MLEMYDQLGTPEHLKLKKAFPEAGDHVLTSYLSTENYEAVTREVLEFLTDILTL